MNKNETEARPNGIHAFPKHARHEALHHPRILKQMNDPSLISFAGGNPAPESFRKKNCRGFGALACAGSVGMLQYSVTEGVPAVLEQVRRFANRHELRVRRQDALLLCTGSQQVLDLATKCLCNEGRHHCRGRSRLSGRLQHLPQLRRKAGGRAHGGGRREPCRAGGRVRRAGKAPLFLLHPQFPEPYWKDDEPCKAPGCAGAGAQIRCAGAGGRPLRRAALCRRARAQHQKPGQGNSVIYAASFSKILCPGMRLAFCACDEKLARSMVVAKQGSDVHTNVWAQRVCAELLRTMDMDAHICAVSAMYGRKAALMAQLLREKCPQLTFEAPQGGMFLMGRAAAGCARAGICAGLLGTQAGRHSGQRLLCGWRGTVPGHPAEFSTPSEDAIRRGVDIMAQVLKKLIGQSVCSV